MLKRLLVVGIVALAGALPFVGCSSVPVTIEKDLGAMPAVEKGVENMAERRAMLELSTQMNQNQKTDIFVIKFQSVWPSGSTLPVNITYNRREKTLQRQGKTGRGLSYSGVTDQVISATVREAQLAEDVEKSRR